MDQRDEAPARYVQNGCGEMHRQMCVFALAEGYRTIRDRLCELLFVRDEHKMNGFIAHQKVLRGEFGVSFECDLADGSARLRKHSEKGSIAQDPMVGQSRTGVQAGQDKQGVGEHLMHLSDVVCEVLVAKPG